MPKMSGSFEGKSAQAEFYNPFLRADNSHIVTILSIESYPSTELEYLFTSSNNLKIHPLGQYVCPKDLPTKTRLPELIREHRRMGEG